jgi:hypothetical protein
VKPKVTLARAGIQPANEVAFTALNGEIRIRKAEDERATQAHRIKALRGIWSIDPGGSNSARR